MAIDRRLLLQGLCALSLLPAVPAIAGRSVTRFASAAMTADGRHHLALFDTASRDRSLVPLPDRAHDIIALPGDRLLAMARRPGRFAAVIDARHGQIEQIFEAMPGRHFYGHAVLGGDGEYLYTSENEFDARRGVIGVRSASDGWRHVAELPSHGIGPHEIHLGPDGATLIVANGGIVTHPHSGRRKLNLDRMTPNLARVAVADGSLLDHVVLPQALSRLSLRHIDVRSDGLVAVAGQYQGALPAGMPLVATWRPGGTMTVLPLADDLAQRMRGYCASVRYDRSGAFLAVSGPRGGLVGFWAVNEGRFLGQVELADGAGIACAGHGCFVLSSGTGALETVELRHDRQPRTVARASLPWHWDNHLTAV